MSRMTSETASRYIQSFQKSFGEAHFYFACHAALPIALTPDLLYVLWKNFQHDINGEQLNIPWIAVADLLLSGLCHEVGHELYEMDLSIRNILLKNLQENKNFGQPRINELSNFLLNYAHSHLYSEDQDIRDLAQTHNLTALGYLNSSQAAREIALLFARTDQENTLDLLRITSLVEMLAEPLFKYKELLIYSQGVSNTLHGNIIDTTPQFVELLKKESPTYFSLFTLPIPKQIKNNLLIYDTLYSKLLKIISAGLTATLVTTTTAFGLMLNSSSLLNYSEPIPQDVSTQNSISQDAALETVSSWLKAKREIFAPPYKTEKGRQLLTGTAYESQIQKSADPDSCIASGKDDSSCLSSVQWLVRNNAYWTYGVQRIDAVKRFESNGDRATLVVDLTEQRTLSNSKGNIDRTQSGIFTSTVTYYLVIEDGQVKISNYNIKYPQR
jgi:hypothetical protein